MFQWVSRIKCFFGFHQYISIREIWVRYKQPVYYDNEYGSEGEHIVSVIYCPICNKRVNIKILK